MHMRQTVTAVVTGKPIEIGGSRGRREATGRGVMLVVSQAVKKLGMVPWNTRVVVQGFGNVGSYAALLLHEQGFKITGIAEWDADCNNANGIDIKRLFDYKASERRHSGIPRRRVRQSGRTADLRLRGAGSGGHGKRDHHPQRRQHPGQNHRRRRQRPHHGRCR